MVSNNFSANMKLQLQRTVLEYAPRLLTQLDRDPLSPTYGCFDRSYWHYKIRDFSSMVLQQNILSLAYLYHYPFKNSSYYRSPLILEFVHASINYWAKTQHRNGGFDEYWPNECGYPPLVFSTHAVLRAIILLKLKSAPYKKFLLKAISQISQYQEKNALNQEAAGVMCLYYYYQIFGDQNIKKTFEIRLESLLNRQSNEGWFPEYGGADIGYSSVFLNYLSELVSTEYHALVIEPLSKQIEFLHNFVHPDGTVGGEYGSRNTEYFLLSGLVRMQKFSKQASWMIKNIKWNLNNLDDRYLYHYIFHSYIEGSYNLSAIAPNSFVIKSQVHYFPESGLYVNKSSSIYFVSNLKKGGVFKLYLNQVLHQKCGGYRIKSGNSFFVTNWLTDAGSVKINNSMIKCSTFLHKNNFQVITPIKHCFLRMIAVLPYKQTIISSIKKLLIHQDKPTPTLFHRSFSFSNTKLVITDSFTPPQSINADWSIEGSLRFVPSSKFYDSSVNTIKDSHALINFQPGKMRTWVIKYDKNK